MLVVSDTLKAYLESKNITTNVLIKINFETPLLYTDSISDITFNSEVYTSGPIVAISPPRSQGQVNRDLFDIIIDDPAYELEQQILGDPSGVQTEIHLKIEDEFLPIYFGRVSNYVTSIRRQDQGLENRITITSTGPLAKLYQVSNRSTTEASQKGLFPSDTAFDLSFDSLNESAIKWGDVNGPKANRAIYFTYRYTKQNTP